MVPREERPNGVLPNRGSSASGRAVARGGLREHRRLPGMPRRRRARLRRGCETVAPGARPGPTPLAPYFRPPSAAGIPRATSRAPLGCDRRAASGASFARVGQPSRPRRSGGYGAALGGRNLDRNAARYRWLVSAARGGPHRPVRGRPAGNGAGPPASAMSGPRVHPLLDGPDPSAAVVLADRLREPRPGATALPEVSIPSDPSVT